VKDWLAVGAKTDFCRCAPYAVNIDFELFYRNLNLSVTQFLSKSELKKYYEVRKAQQKVKRTISNVKDIDDAKED
jgi:hypothetical protein